MRPRRLKLAVLGVFLFGVLALLYAALVEFLRGSGISPLVFLGLALLALFIFLDP